MISKTFSPFHRSVFFFLILINHLGHNCCFVEANNIIDNIFETTGNISDTENDITDDDDEIYSNEIDSLKYPSIDTYGVEVWLCDPYKLEFRPAWTKDGNLDYECSRYLPEKVKNEEPFSEDTYIEDVCVAVDDETYANGIVISKLFNFEYNRNFSNSYEWLDDEKQRNVVRFQSGIEICRPCSSLVSYQVLYCPEKDWCSISSTWEDNMYIEPGVVHGSGTVTLELPRKFPEQTTSPASLVPTSSTSLAPTLKGYEVDVSFSIMFNVEPKNRLPTLSPSLTPTFKGYGVDAWLCDSSALEIKGDRYLPQKNEQELFYKGHVLEVCVAPNAKTHAKSIVISELRQFRWYRIDDTSIRQPAIVNGIGAPMTSFNEQERKCKGADWCVFFSVLTADFHNKRAEIRGSGVAALEYSFSKAPAPTATIDIVVKTGGPHEPWWDDDYYDGLYDGEYVKKPQPFVNDFVNEQFKNSQPDVNDPPTNFPTFSPTNSMNPTFAPTSDKTPTYLPTVTDSPTSMSTFTTSTDIGSYTNTDEGDSSSTRIDFIVGGIAMGILAGMLTAYIHHHRHKKKRRKDLAADENGPHPSCADILGNGENDEDGSHLYNAVVSDKNAMWPRDRTIDTNTHSLDDVLDEDGGENAESPLKAEGNANLFACGINEDLNKTCDNNNEAISNILRNELNSRRQAEREVNASTLGGLSKMLKRRLDGRSQNG